MARDTDFWIDLNKGESPIRVWDKLTLGGVTFPGICQVECAVDLDISVEKFRKTLPSGTTPSKFLTSMIDGGYNPGKVRATIIIWEKDQWEDMKETLPKFSPVSGDKYMSADTAELLALDGASPTRSKATGKGRDAFDISHPATHLLGISTVIVKGVAIPPVIDQTFTVIMDLWQYFPETPFARNQYTKGAGGNVDATVPNPSKNAKT